MYVSLYIYMCVYVCMRVKSSDKFMYSLKRFIRFVFHSEAACGTKFSFQEDALHSMRQISRFSP